MDLRQLGSVVYKKVTTSRQSSSGMELAEGEEVLGFSRRRKQRIVMVSGKGTGYGGEIPVLADSMEVCHESDGAAVSAKVRSLCMDTL